MAPFLLFHSLLLNKELIMRIENASATTALQSRLHAVAARHAPESASFGSILSSTGTATEAAPASTVPTARQELLDKLGEYIEKGPIVAMREKILESMGLTEEKLKALPPEKQEAVEAEIAEKIKEMLLKQQETGKGQAQRETTGETRASAYAALAGV